MYLQSAKPSIIEIIQNVFRVLKEHFMIKGSHHLKECYLL